MKTHFTIVMVYILILYCNSFAATKCPQPIRSIQDELNCDQSLIERADKKVNIVYEKLFHSLSKDLQSELKKSQDLWVLYREEESSFSRLIYLTGIMGQYLYSSTYSSLSDTRAKQLQEYLVMISSKYSHFKKPSANEMNTISSKLNSTYKATKQFIQIHEGTNPSIHLEEITELEETQKDWLKFREQTCIFEAKLATSHLQFNDRRNSCTIRLSLERIKDLQKELEMRKNS